MSKGDPRHVDLSKEVIAECFKGKTHQADVLLALYRVVHPDFDRIKKFTGWPKANEETCIWIMNAFRDFDDKHHPNVMAGGIWINNGFTIDNTLPSWVVEQCPREQLFYIGDKYPVAAISIVNMSAYTVDKKRSVTVRFWRHGRDDTKIGRYEPTRSSYKRLAYILKVYCEKKGSLKNPHWEPKEK